MAAGLTKEQLDKFEKDGLLVIEDFLTLEEVEGLKSEITKLVENMDPETDRGVFSTKDNNNRQVSWTKGKINQRPQDLLMYQLTTSFCIF